jgi:hypothetical protein
LTQWMISLYGSTRGVVVVHIHPELPPAFHW